MIARGLISLLGRWSYNAIITLRHRCCCLAGRSGKDAVVGQKLECFKGEDVFKVIHNGYIDVKQMFKDNILSDLEVVPL